MSCCVGAARVRPQGVKFTVEPAAGLGVVVLMTIAVSGPVFTVIADVRAECRRDVAGDGRRHLAGGFEMRCRRIHQASLLTVATPEAEVVQVALPVRSLVLPSL